MLRGRGKGLPAKPRGRGFVLIELVVVLALIGIIAALTWPSYSMAMRRVFRSEAITALAEVQLAQERWRAEHPAYAADLASLGVQPVTPGGHYAISVVSAGESGHVAAAFALASQRADRRCVRLTLTQSAGVVAFASADDQGTVDSSSPNRCWKP